LSSRAEWNEDPGTRKLKIKQIPHQVRNDNKKKMKDYYVYIATNKNNTVLYTGVTNNIKRRMHEHKEKLVKSFTSKYNVNKLVYIEHFNDIMEAIHREKQLKKWKRQWKIELIEKMNKDWIDLYNEI
jgi:putative endonuclease